MTRGPSTSLGCRLGAGLGQFALGKQQIGLDQLPVLGFGDGEFLFEFDHPAPPASRGAALQPALDRYAEVLARYAKRYPLNWFNFYPYWADDATRLRA